MQCDLMLDIRNSGVKENDVDRQWLGEQVICRPHRKHRVQQFFYCCIVFFALGMCLLSFCVNSSFRDHLAVCVSLLDSR